MSEQAIRERDTALLPISGERALLPPQFDNLLALQEWAVDNDVELQEITEEQWTQKIEIEHEVVGPRAGELRVRTERTGEAGIALCLDAAWTLYKERYESPQRPTLDGECKIMISLRDNRLQMAYEPVANPNQVKSALAAALFGLMQQCADGEFNPVSELAGLLNLE